MGRSIFEKWDFADQIRTFSAMGEDDVFCGESLTMYLFDIHVSVRRPTISSKEL